MKFKHRMGWTSGTIDIGGVRCTIIDGVFATPNDDPQVIQRLKAAGHVPIEGTKPKSEPEVVESKAWELTVDELTEVKGVGKSYAEAIINEFPTSEDLVAAGAAEIAKRINGISESKAQEIIEHVLA